MTGDLIINGVDVASHGIEMGRGFLDALRTSLAFKSSIENDSAKEHGKMVVLNGHYASRDVTLTFNVHGDSVAGFEANDAWFLNLLYSRTLSVRIKGDPNVYRLLYSGNGVTYAHSISGKMCIRAGKFTELNPANRGETSTDSLFAY